MNKPEIQVIIEQFYTITNDGMLKAMSENIADDCMNYINNFQN